MFNKITIGIFELDVVKKLLRILPDKQYILLNYFVANNRLPNIKNPETLSEKIQWMKVYGGLEKYSQYVDKYTVREYIKETVGEKYLIPLIGVWDNFEEIPFDKLPDKFVLKTTHGSSYNFICKDKSLLDKKALKIKVNKWLNENFYLKTREIQYKHIKPRIICEEYLDEGPRGLTDYKFFCNNGTPQIIEIISDRVTQPVLDLFDLHFNRLPIMFGFPNSKNNYKKPKNFEEMILICKKLSKIFPFVRVDLYCIKNKIYFGELTFTPSNGLDIAEPEGSDRQLGELIGISKFKRN